MVSLIDSAVIVWIKHSWILQFQSFESR